MAESVTDSVADDPLAPIEPPFRWLRLLDDLWNPILVKEVRQSLRGKFFRVSFFCTLIAVTISSLALITSMGNEISSNEGREYFVGVFYCLAIAVLGLVPFAAFNSMGSEWDENTFDLLVISNLKPRQIIFGKLLSAMAQSVLFFSAFTPFLVFSFLLQKVDLVVVLITLVATGLLSILLSIVALMLSTLSKVRFARVVLMAGLAGLLVAVISPSGVLVEEALRNPGTFRDDEWLIVGPMLLVSGLLAAAFALGTASNLLAHAEENRSTGMRILSTIALLIGIGFCNVVIWWNNNRGFGDREIVSAMGMVLLGFVFVPALFFVTERDALGRRVAPRVPRHLGTAAFVTPFLPGGARGVLLVTLQTGLVTLFVLVGQALVHDPHPSGRGFFGDGIAAYFVLLLYGAFYLLLPSAIFAGSVAIPQLRAAVRALIPLLVIIFAFVPALIGFFIGDDMLMEGRHAGNPAYLIEQAWDRGVGFSHDWFLLFALVGVGVLWNVPRVWRALVEVARARRTRLETEARAAFTSSRDDRPDAYAGA